MGSDLFWQNHNYFWKLKKGFLWNMAWCVLFHFIKEIAVMSGVQSPDASTRYCNVAATQKHLKIWSKDDLDHDHTSLSFCGVFFMSNNVQMKRFKCERKKFLILTMTKFIFLPAISCYLLKHNLCHTYAVRIVPKVHSNHIWARFLGVSNSRDFWSVWGLFFPQGPTIWFIFTNYFL